MLKSDKFTVTCNFAKSQNFATLDYVKSIVRDAEYTSAKNRKIFADNVETLTTAFPGRNIWELKEEEILVTMGSKGSEFLKAYNAVKELKVEVDNCLPITEVTALSASDRAYLNVLAFTIMPTQTLSKNLFAQNPFEAESGEKVDLTKAIEKWFKSGSKLSDIKNCLRGAMNRIFSGSDNFNKVVIRKSDISDEMARHFFASFSGAKTVEGKRSYYTKTAQETLIRAFTELCAVCLTDNKRHEVVKEPAQTPETTK